MDGSTRGPGLRYASERTPGSRHGSRRLLVAGALSAMLALGGCVSVSTNVTPPPTATPFSGVTPPPTPGDETPEPVITPEPEPTPGRTRRPRATPTEPPAATPRPTRKPTPTPPPDPTDEPTSEPTTPAMGTPTPTPTMAPTPEPTVMPNGWPAGSYDSEQAKDHVGESGTVCGTVVAAQYLPEVRGRPTFLNIDQPYPNQSFNVVIWGEQRRNFPLNRKPEIFMLGKVVCTTGDISTYVDWTQIAYADRQGTKVIP